MSLKCILVLYYWDRSVILEFVAPSSSILVRESSAYWSQLWILTLSSLPGCTSSSWWEDQVLWVRLWRDSAQCLAAGSYCRCCPWTLLAQGFATNWNGELNWPKYLFSGCFFLLVCLFFLNPKQFLTLGPSRAVGTVLPTPLRRWWLQGRGPGLCGRLWDVAFGSSTAALG